jgi:very-short-patch-repair endonuclease/DNA polymerase III delta prime subunit
MSNCRDDLIRQRLEAARRNLLDTSLRNKLINYRPSKASGVEVVGEDPVEVYRLLVKEGKSMIFIGKPDLQEESLLEKEEGSSKLAPVDTTDNKLNTNETESKLYIRLLKTWRDARSTLEEQGVNTLFLALGMLHWYDSEASQESKKAPLILIPVLIERHRSTRFRISYDGTEVGSNLSLIAILQQQFGIDLPEISEPENLDVAQYFQQVAKAVADQPRWRVDDKAIVLSFFSYAKYLMFKDLGGEAWPEGQKPWMHSVIRALLGDGFEGDGNPGIGEEENIDKYRPVEQAWEVFDADASQLRAILEAKSGRSMIIEGPPGTGKSQTIANLIAEAIAEGKKSLFVSEKRAALEVVWQRLREAGLHEACLELHSSKANKRDFYEQLKRTLYLSRPQTEQKQQELKRLSQIRDCLNEYCQALHTPLPQRGIPPFLAMGQLLKLGKETEGLRKPNFSIMSGWTQPDFENKRELVRKIQSVVKETGIPSENPFWGSGLMLLLPEDRNEIASLIKETIKMVQQAFDLTCRLDHDSAEAVRDAIIAKQQGWELEIDDIQRNIAQYGDKWYRIFVPSYHIARWKLRSLWARPLPKSREEMIYLIHVVQSVLAASHQLNSLLRRLEAKEPLNQLAKLPFPDQLARLNTWLTDLTPLQHLAAFNRLCEEARQQGLEEVAKIASSWELAGDRLVEVFDRVWYSGVVREAFESRPILAMLESKEHENLIREFRDLDTLMLKINRAKVALKHWEQVPRYTAGGSLGLLLREIEKQRGHKPIRKIMAEASEAIEAIKPVFMMSPLSVAMYLPPDGPRFDLVIFDEASQIKPEDAFGAIIRAKQTIVVGDSKQLPPTSFFDRLTQVNDNGDEGEEVDVNITRGMESILALMNSKIPPGSPQRRDLRWHYRSKHDSLIACSNRLFYNERLIVPPSKERKPKYMGLVFHHLPHTVYGRGGSKKNLEEARIVMQSIIRHIKESPDLSLGVAAFSIAQQEAIEDELERLRRENTEIETLLVEFDRRHETEPLFVKNLETVQGDERDVIFISVGYGRDANGYISMNFGPLNKEGGERRLNVLITRARIRCEIFSNLRYSDIRVDENSPQGVKALRTFLHFAETGEIDVPTPTDREPMSPFEEDVIDALRSHGYQVVPQVGSVGFYIDIGVCDPHNPGKFVLGIECDGAQYHSSKSARDRDRLRQAVLEARGWRIHRIWSTDWYKNREAELRRLLQVIEQAITTQSELPVVPPLSNQGARGQGDADREITFKGSEIATRLPAISVPEYTFAQPKINLGWRQLREISPAEMSDLVIQVVEVESPVHFEEVVRRIREAAGLARAGNAIRKAVLHGIKYASANGKVIFDEPFVLKNPPNRPIPRSRSNFPNHIKKLEYIHPDEIKAALILVVERSFGISAEEAKNESLKLLGFERVTENMSDFVDTLIQELCSKSELQLQGGLLRRSK